MTRDRLQLSSVSPWRSAYTWALATLVLVSVGLVATYVPDQPTLSPYDEWVYVDYVDKLTRFDIPQQGENVDEYALEIASCRGVFVWGTIGSPCGGPYDHRAYPLGGVTSADIHPPTYFAATAGGAALLRKVGLSDDLLTSSRAMGAIWLFLGLVLVGVLAMELGASLSAAVGGASVLASLPLIRWTNSYITPDALNTAIGAGVLLTALHVSRGRWPWWTLVPVGFLAGAVKTQNVLAVAAAVLFLVWSVLSVVGRSRRRKVLGALGVTVGFLVAQVGWLVARAAASLGDSPDTGAEGPASLALVVRETGAFVFRLGLGDTQPIPAYAYFSAALLVAGCVGSVIYRSARTEVWGIGTAVTVMVFTGSPLLLLTQFVAFGEVTAAPNRYGASLLAGIVAVTASAFSSRNRGRALLMFGLACVLIVLIDNQAR